jgi:iron complex transport system ATP-binding protein
MMIPPAGFTNLSTGYRHKKLPIVVNSSLSAQLKTGEMTCLLGANGSGKSTLVKTLCGFLPPLKGEVVLNGMPLDQLSVRQRAAMVSIVLTDKIESTTLTVEELTTLGRSPHTGFLGRLKPADHVIVQQAMQSAGIIHKRHQSLSQLSDGERQKALIAKALAQDTPLIVLDEPTAFLDMPARVEIMHLLRQLCSQQQKCILITTHDLDLALQMADRLWLLHSHGPLISGTPEDLLLQGALQELFHRHGITFDHKTGLFRITHQFLHQIEVKGHGFGYVLLRRALARRGIAPLGRPTDSGICITVSGQDHPCFELYWEGSLLLQTKQMEPLMNQVTDLIKNTAHLKMHVQ